MSSYIISVVLQNSQHVDKVLGGVVQGLNHPRHHEQDVKVVLRWKVLSCLNVWKKQTRRKFQLGRRKDKKSLTLLNKPWYA